MKYEDSLTEPSLHMFEPQTFAAIKSRDSESRHGDDQSEDGVLDQIKDADEDQVMKKHMERSERDSHIEGQLLITGAVETNTNQSKHTTSRFCVVLWAVQYVLTGDNYTLLSNIKYI